ncbi:MAG: serine/threonine protein kinase [Pirellulales bacterium]
MHDTVGRLGPFALEERLSGREDGSVFRAVHIQGQRVLAVKFLPLSVVADAAATAAFTRQVGVLKSLHHRNIVCYYGGGRAGGQPYVAAELVYGQSLNKVLERGPLAWETVVEIGLQLCAGLEFCHQRWIIHQQLRPSSVIWGEDGVIKIVGVGLAEFEDKPPRRDDFDDAGFSDAADAFYLSPEQITGAALTTRADLYALGCLLYELLTGRPPFSGETADQVRQQHLNQPAPRVLDTLFDCPVWLNAIVAQLLEKDPANRPAFASAVAVALRETQEHVAAGTGVAQHCLSDTAGAIEMQQSKGEVRRMFGRKKRPRRSKSPFYESVWFLSTCACLLLGLGIWVLWPPGEQELFAQAAELMDSQERAEWRRARQDFIEPLLKRFPQGQHAAQAQGWIDQIDIDQAETKIKAGQRIGRAPSSEAERLYLEALRYEEFGDKQTAWELLAAIPPLFKNSEDDRPLAKLAQQMAARLAFEVPDSGWRSQWLAAKLDDADRLAEEGQPAAARAIWLGVTELYRDILDLRSHFKRAQAGLSGKPPAPDGGQDLPGQPDTSVEGLPIESIGEDQPPGAGEAAGR